MSPPPERRITPAQESAIMDILGVPAHLWSGSKAWCTQARNVRADCQRCDRGRVDAVTPDGVTVKGECPYCTRGYLWSIRAMVTEVTVLCVAVDFGRPYRAPSWTLVMKSPGISGEIKPKDLHPTKAAADAHAEAMQAAIERDARSTP